MPETSSSPQSSPPRSGGPVGRDDRRPADTPFERVLRQAAQRNQRQTFAQRFLRPAVSGLADKTEGLYKNSNLDAVRFRLLQAGFPSGLRARDFMALKLVSLCLVPAMMTIYIPIFSLILDMQFPPLLWAFILVLSCWLGWRVPDIWLAIATKKRQTEIQLVLPDMIDLITISVEAGLGLYAAIQRVSMSFDNPLSDEFLRSLQEARLGRTNNEALRDLVRRADVEDLTMFISSLIQAETLGVPIANVLRAQTERLRDKRRQRAREQAQKAPLKMLFPLVFFIFPALFVVILGPAMLRIMDNGF
jgi:tight adherence protein C